MPAVYSIPFLSFDINHSSQMRNLRSLRFKRTNRALTCQLFGYPVATLKKTNVHARVATAEFLMNLRTHQILQQQTDNSRSKSQLLLYSQLVGLGLLVELQTSGAEHSADIICLQMLVILPVMPLLH